ncbi:MAG TPA: glycosyl hydrolase family 28-related protein [Bryobacteraceae bacterium]|nr:glycosyl hydrolase family 28-related protein [Bryobacteraceae bacterium]
MVSGLLARLTALFSTFCSVAAFAAVTPYPPYPGAEPSPAYRVAVDGQPVFVHRFLTYNQFQWMDYASFAMTGKVRVTVTMLVSERKVLTCAVRPLAYGIQLQISGNTCSFELDRPRYLLVFLNEEPRFYGSGLMLFAEPPETNPPRLGDPNVVNIMDYQVDNTGKTVETGKINRAISDVSARPGGGVLFFPAGGVYLTGTLLMKSNVRLYVDAGALIRGTGKIVDYTSAPAPPGAPPGGRPLRAQVIFDHVENAGLMGRGAIDMDGYPELWFDFAPDTSDGRARSANGLVKDPHGAGARGYVVSNSRNISFQGLLLLRSAEWTVHVINSEHFSTRNIKIVNRKQQYHDDIYDLTGNSKHISIEEGFAMGMDDTFALYGGRETGAGLEDILVKGFVNYTSDTGVGGGYGGAAPVKHLRFEDVHFVANQQDYAVWFQLTPTFWTGQAYPEGAKMSRIVVIDDIRFVNCTFENDGGHVYIDAGESPVTNFVFENCTFGRPTRPSLLTGKNVAPILFKNVKVNGAVIRNAGQLRQAGFDLSVPVKFEP